MPDAFGTRDERGELVDRQGSGVESRRTQEVRVAMRGACDLPQPEPLAVGLAGRQIAEPPEHVGLALNDHHGDTRIAADLVAAGEEATTRFIVGGFEAVERPALDRSAGAGTALEQERRRLRRRAHRPR